MFASGMKASELIQELQKLIDKHGDQEVYAGGGDYPGGVTGVAFIQKGDGYVPTGSFKIYEQG